MRHISNHIKKELERLNVGIVYLFGSVAQGISSLKSDIDLGIVFTGINLSRNNPHIRTDLEIIFSNIYKNRDVDIVFLQDAHLTVQLNAINYSEVIYQVSPEFRANYEENVVILYGDFEPLLREFDKMVLERIQ